MDSNKLKIINSNINDSKHFKSIDEFNLFYQNNKEMMNNKTTQWLNKNYSIITDNGDVYRITKINTRDNDGKRQCGQICLKKVKVHENMNDNDMKDNMNELKYEIMNEKLRFELIERIKDEIKNEIKDENNDEQINILQTQGVEIQRIFEQLKQFYSKYKSKIKLYDEKMKYLESLMNELSAKINKMDNVITQVVKVINGQ